MLSDLQEIFVLRPANDNLWTLWPSLMTRHRRAVVILALSLGVSLALYVAAGSRELPHLERDHNLNQLASLWRSESVTTRDREAIVDALVRTGWLLGLPESEVLELLGKPVGRLVLRAPHGEDFVEMRWYCGAGGPFGRSNISQKVFSVTISAATGRATSVSTWID